MINDKYLKKISDYSQEYIAKHYEYDKQKFSTLIKAGRMVYVVKKRTNAATYFYVNYVDNNKVLNFPPAYSEFVGGFNKDTQLTRVTGVGANRALLLHMAICSVFDLSPLECQNFTTL